MGVLASNGKISIDQQVDQAVPVPMARRPDREPCLIEVLAVQWKRQMQLQGAGKDGSRDLATNILPTLASKLRCA
jgi:hypothetical protein